MPTPTPLKSWLADTLRWIGAMPTRSTGLQDLDDRTLADIGVDRSEIASIEAERSGHSAVTRLRIVARARHA